MRNFFIASLLVVTSCFFLSTTHAATQTSTQKNVKSVKSLFGVSLYVYNYSSTPIRVTEFYTTPYDVPPFNGYYNLSTMFGNLYGVGFYYYTAYGTFYPVPNCYAGNLYDDLAVIIQDAYVNGYLVPVCAY